MSLGYIQYSEIVLYLNENWIFDPEDRLDYIKWVQFIDLEYVSFQHDKQKDKRPAKPGKK